MLSDDDYNRLFRYGIMLAGNEDDAWDLLHQAVENYFQVEKNDVRGGKVNNITAYLRAAMRNRHIDKRRHAEKFEHIDYDECANEPVLNINEPTLEDILITKQQYDVCMENMNLDERELLYLFAVEGYTVQEIADEKNVSKGTMLSRIHRLKARLKKQLMTRDQDKRAM